MPPTVVRSVINLSSTTSQATRSYIPLKSPLRQHNAHRHWSSTSRCALNEVHNAAAQRDPLDGYLETIISKDLHHVQTSIQNIYSQYQARAYTVIDRVIPYEERPKHDRRADAIITGEHGAAGNGLVTVIHAIWNDRETRLEKVAVCSGFVVDASVNDSGQGDTIVTCAHTLEQVGQRIAVMECCRISANSCCRFAAVSKRPTTAMIARRYPSYSRQVVSQDQLFSSWRPCHATTC